MDVSAFPECGEAHGRSQSNPKLRQDGLQPDSHRPGALQHVLSASSDPQGAVPEAAPLPCPEQRHRRAQSSSTAVPGAAASPCPEQLHHRARSRSIIVPRAAPSLCISIYAPGRPPALGLLPGPECWLPTDRCQESPRSPNTDPHPLLVHHCTLEPEHWP